MQTDQYPLLISGLLSNHLKPMNKQVLLQFNH